MRTEQEVKAQIRAVRERVTELSGFYIGEAAAMTYALEWVLGKRETVPSSELGRPDAESLKIAENLTKAVEKAATARPSSKAPPEKSRKQSK